MPHPEVPRSNLEPTLAVLDGIGRKSRSIHREVIHIWSKRIETVCKPHIFELISNLTHPLLLRLTPLRSLKRNVDSCGQQSKERSNHQPGTIWDLNQEKVTHLGKGGRCLDVDEKCRDDQNRSKQFRRDLHRRITTTEDDRH